MMKIAVATGGHIPSFRAHSIAVMKMAKGFYKLGHDVEVLTVERFVEDRLRRQIKDLHEFYGVSSEIKITFFRDDLFYFENLSIISYLYRFLDKVTNRRIRMIRDPEKMMSKYCKDYDFDLCYYRGYGRTVYYNVVKNKVPTIMESHIRNIVNPDLKRAIKVSRSEYFKGLVTISELLKHTFVKAGVPEKKVLVLDSGVDLELFEHLPDKMNARKMLNLPLGRKVVVYAGSLFPEKGIKYILLVAEQLRDVMFVLVGGEAEHVRYWRRYARTRGLGNVRFMGFVSNSLIPIYLAAADALVMPYGKERARIMDIESTSPLKLFEYMAARKPIISTRIPAIQRIIQHGVNGLLTEPGNVKQLTEYVRYALENEKFAKSLSERAYEMVKDYDWKKRCQKILKHFCDND